MQKDKISVIIPCYNQGSYIDEAVGSVLAQSYQNFEIIIINDGSTDEFTNAKLANYNIQKTRVLHTENQGLAQARNEGFKSANGEFIQFLDADDIIYSTKFEEQIAIFNKNTGIDVCYTDYKIFDIDKNEYLSLNEKSFLGEDPLYDFLFRWERGLSIPIHCALFRKNLWGKDLPFNENLKAKEDWFLWCTLATMNKQFYFLNQELAVYRFHSDNMTHNVIKMSQYFLLASLYIGEFIPSKHKDKFFAETTHHLTSVIQIKIYPEMVWQIHDLKKKFKEMDKTIDFRVGHAILKPYRRIKSMFSLKNL